MALCDQIFLITGGRLESRQVRGVLVLDPDTKREQTP